MLKKKEKNSILEVCPVRNVIARFGNKWSLLVILILHEKALPVLESWLSIYQMFLLRFCRIRFVLLRQMRW